ncbi:Uma2 family endonuclease [Granulicella aggregans]|jgi:Uma2 family endonuclease|uniref:Uma2 family endonuclease n=1 Tax=Granulicella aggregans TaxID=474949 RepID=UPI0021DFE043|nr:Uma2 family endonuclease [Granulicella aggregans]
MAALAESLELEILSLTGLTMPVTLRPARKLGDIELMAFSRRNRPYRIEQNAEGELEIMTPLNTKGGYREIFVGARLFDWAETHGGMVFSSSAGFTLIDNSVRSPDASWLSGAQWNALTDAEQRSFAPACPEFLVEILSESDSRVKLEEKMEMWIANGAQLAWMIDPFAGEVLVYRPGQSVERLARPEWVEAEAVVPGFRLEMARLWSK